MSKDYNHNPFNLDPSFITNVREILDKACFNENSILRRLESTESIRVEPRALPRLLRMTEEASPLDSLIRLFLLGVKVELADAEKAIQPMSLKTWLQGGLLKVQGNSVTAPIQLVPYMGMFFAYDPPTSRYRSEVRPDHVHGMGPVSVDLLNATIRRKIAKVLDLGAGCGVQGMMCSKHTDQVVSCDINTRALNFTAFNSRLNGITNINICEGNLFKPVTGEKFDLIVMNPPFVISPSKRLVFRDSGMEGDSFLQRIVKEVPQFLNQKGFCQIIGQWAHVGNEDWKDRLASWFKGSGCDVWIIKRATQSIEAYAESWITETEKHNAEEYIQRWNHWTTHLASQGITKISTGIITMRRANGGKNWFWTNEDVEEIDPYAGEAIYQGFVLRDYLSNLRDGEELLRTPLKISPDVVTNQVWASAGQGWRPTNVVLRHRKGLHYQGNVDGHFIALLGQCNGKTPLSTLVAELARSLHGQPENIIQSIVDGMRNLIERGFVTPPLAEFGGEHFASIPETG